jgi:mono/diheme cytochrome c family protein
MSSGRTMPPHCGAAAASAVRATPSQQGRGSREDRHAIGKTLQPALVRILATFLAVFFLGGCYRQQMAAQPKYDPLEPSDFFVDGMSARPRVAGTVARGELVGNDFLNSGRIGAADGDGIPFPVTAALLGKGRERFNIYCSECHGRLGDGDGMIPRRGYRRPPSYHTSVLRHAPTGHFFDVITNGFGAMPPYGTMIPRDDRWAIIAYIRALQLSQNATIDDVPEADRTRLSAGAAK